MAFCHGRDFLFCDMCGAQLSLSSPKFVSCPLCGFKRSAQEIQGRETRYTITAEDIRRELKIEPFVQTEAAVVDEGVKRPIANRPCPECGNLQAEYYTRQMRSADEGQTTFYECTKCRHKFSEN